MEDCYKILIIDDEPLIRSGLANLLEKKFPNVKTSAQASNGIEGYRDYEKYSPDLVISDIVMPMMTGLELLEKIRMKDPDIPIILISGYNEFSYAKQAIKLGVSEYILKPISMQEMYNAVKKIMEEDSHAGKKARIDYEQIVESAKTLFLQKLVNGELKNAGDYRAAMKNLGLDFQSFPLCVITTTFQASDDMEKMHFLVREAENGEKAVSFIMKNSVITLLFCNYGYARHWAKLLSVFLFGKKITGFRIGIGKEAENFGNIQVSFELSRLALTYQIYDEDKTIFTQEDINNSQPSTSSADINTEELIALLRGGSDEEVGKWIQDFFSKLFYTRTPPPSYIKGMCIFLISDVEKQLAKTIGLDRSKFTGISPEELNGIHSISGIRTVVTGHMMKLKHEVIPDSMINNDPVIHKTKKYIQANIGSMISQNDIAEQFNMNPTYFSTYFKAKTGETFRAYVNRKKMEYAKELLSDSGLSMEDISQKLGYAEFRSFYRIFKNLTGLSPSDYKKMMKGNANVQ